jgi:hypothetical protein
MTSRSRFMSAALGSSPREHRAPRVAARRRSGLERPFHDACRAVERGHILIHGSSGCDGCIPADLRLGPEAVVSRRHRDVLDSQDLRWIDVSRSSTLAEPVEGLGRPAQNGSAWVRGWGQQSSSWWLSLLVLGSLSFGSRSVR